MHLLFMSNLFPKETKEDVQSKMKFNMYDAANVLQWNLIDGFEANGISPSLFNLLPVDSWPQHYKDAFVKRHTFSHKEGANDINVGFCNIKYIKRIVLKSAYVKEIKNWEKRTRNNEERTVIIYSLTPSFLSAVKILKKRDPKIKALAIMADLPEFSAPARNLVRKIYRDLYNKKAKQSIDAFDGFVLLTDAMAERMGIKAPYMVMEGIAGERKEIPDSNKNENTVFYSGSMNIKYGILTLLDAFSKINDQDMKLILCGLGDAEDIIKQRSSNDPRIKFLGKVAHEKALELQQQATVLVNPRQNNEEFTKYSFPSKTMEYLSSGTPVVAYKLDGIPDEYDEYINYVPDNAPETLAATIQKVCEMSSDERKKMGQRARDFVLEEKNNVKQTKRILDFVKDGI